MNSQNGSPDFYQTHHRAYHDRTFSVDAAPFLKPFANHLPRGARVLDVGCGSGRDLLWLKKRGFEALGFERSAGLAGLARRNAGCKVISGDFKTFDFSTLAVDAVLMSGSLVHIPHPELPAVLARILCACRPSAPVRPSSDGANIKTPKHAYISLKEGRRYKRFGDGRIFYLWDREALLSVFESMGLIVKEALRTPSPLRSDETWLAFVVTL